MELKPDIQSIFDKYVKYPSIDYPEKVANEIEFPNDVVFEWKYDGSNVAVWVHNGELIVSSRRRAVADNTLFNGTLTALGEYVSLSELKEFLGKKKLVFYCELFGSKNTPAGYHRNYPKPLDIVVFDVARLEDSMFINPLEAYMLVSDLGLKFVEAKVKKVENFEELLLYATELSHYEGCVAKIYDDKYRRGVLMMKWKPQEITTKNGELPFSEICGVIAKAIQRGEITPEMKEKQIFKTLRRLVREEAEKHGLRYPSEKNIIYRAYSIVRTRIISPETIEEIISQRK